MVTIAMQSMELGSGLDNVKKIMDMETMKSGQQTLSKTGCYGIDFDNCDLLTTHKAERMRCPTLIFIWNRAA